MCLHAHFFVIFDTATETTHLFKLDATHPTNPDRQMGSGIDGIDGTGAGKPHECSSLEKAGRPRERLRLDVVTFGSANIEDGFSERWSWSICEITRGYRSILSSFVLEFKDAMIGV